MCQFNFKVPYTDAPLAYLGFHILLDLQKNGLKSLFLPGTSSLPKRTTLCILHWRPKPMLMTVLTLTPFCFDHHISKESQEKTANYITFSQIYEIQIYSVTFFRSNLSRYPPAIWVVILHAIKWERRAVVSSSRIYLFQCLYGRSKSSQKRQKKSWEEDVFLRSFIIML